MTSLTTPAIAGREEFLHTSPANAVSRPSSSNLATHVGANLGAGLLIGASAAIGAYYGYVTGAHVHLALGVVFCAAALGGELLKPIAVAAAIDAFRRWEIGRGVAAVLLALVTMTYSLASELSIAAGVRGDVSAERQGAADDAQRWRAKRTRAADELAALPLARPVAELEPLITKARAVSGASGCGRHSPTTSAGRRACADAADLSAELGRAQRRMELDAAISAADRALSTPGARSAEVPADPLAAALSAYVSAAGYSLKPADVAPWLALIPVIFLEIGSAVAIVVARAAGAAPATVPAPAAEALPAKVAPCPAPADTKAELPAVAKPRRRKDDDRGSGGGGKRLGANVVDLLRRKGGRIEGGQRGIAQALGISKSRTNEILRELADAGEIVMAAGKHGTTLALRA